MFIDFTHHFQLTPKVSSDLYSNFQKTIEKEDIGFFRLAKETQALQSSLKLAEQFQQKKNFYHFGIGGSALGPKMLVHALQKNEKNFHFIENIDSDTIYPLLEKIDFENSVFYFVSKSGSTAETLALLNILISKLNNLEITPSKWKESIVVATERKKSSLANFAEKYELPFLDIPLNVGGRFSALTSVGLFPAAFAGIDCEKLMNGALKASEEVTSPQKKILFLEQAQTLFELSKEGVNQTVLMPYSDKLKLLGDWFVQLWAESLGKEGKGLTPLCALGATDQHSALQLFTQGPNDKAFITINIKNKDFDLPLATKEEGESFQKLSDFGLNQLFKAEYLGTVKALLEAKRNIIEISLEQLTAFHLGYLILYFESLTVLTGELFQIDPFNQPGVESSKKFAWDWLNSQRA